jgi:hypothetical protein
MDTKRLRIFIALGAGALVGLACAAPILLAGGNPTTASIIGGGLGLCAMAYMLAIL